MNRKLRLSLVSLLSIAAFAAIPAAAQSFVPKWEVKLGAGPYKVLLAGTPETLNSTARFGVIGVRANGASIKPGCTGTATEIIENDVIFNEGIDYMTSFDLNCGEGGPDPCLSSEPFSLKGAGLPWYSELWFPSNDAFEGVTLEVECNVSGAKMLYHPPFEVWNPKIGVNALKSSPASGIFRPPHPGGGWFYLLGNDTLTPTHYTKVR